MDGAQALVSHIGYEEQGTDVKDFLTIKLLGLSDSLEARQSALSAQGGPFISFTFSPKTWLCAWHIMVNVYIFFE